MSAMTTSSSISVKPDRLMIDRRHLAMSDSSTMQIQSNCSETSSFIYVHFNRNREAPLMNP